MSIIPFNPYIVGNPIKTKEMFFGREDEFLFVYRKIGESKSNQVIVFCGDRRSGKTSILFQILLGRLGNRFLPILVDLQILAGIKSDSDFFHSIIDVSCSCLGIPGLTLADLKSKYEGQPADALFVGFLARIQEKYPEKTLLFLLDEYELIETKIKEGTLSESTIHFLAGILESTYRVSFIFTGSTNLENRKVDFWKSLLAKSIYKKISYLSYNDTVRLITEPLSSHLSFEKEAIDAIYRLTGGQPFYTQVICQNLVDHLIENENTEATVQHLETVVRDIVNNPLPQMIYSWSNLGVQLRLVLSALGSVITESSVFEKSQSIADFASKNNIKLPFKREQINIFLEDAYEREIIEKNDEGRYRFRMDLFRRWIRKEHSIWKIVKEAGAKLRKPFRNILVASGMGLAGAALVSLVTFFILQATGVIRPGNDKKGIISSILENQALVKDVVLVSNYGYFKVLVDKNKMSMSSEGIGDGTRITLPSIEKGSHSFEFILPVTEERVSTRIEITGDGQVIMVAFKEPDAKRIAQFKGNESGALASVLVSSIPPGAAIKIDGKDYGITPALCDNLAPGAHTVTLELAGYKARSVRMSLKAGKTPAKENLTLEIASGFVVFRIRPTAIVTFEDIARIVNQNERNRELETPRLKPLEVQSGALTFSIENEELGIKGKVITIEIDEGRTVEIDWDLDRESEPTIR